jgi:hypothetical protein
MLQQEGNHSTAFFTVCYQPYDGGTQNDALLTGVRRDYLTVLKRAAGKVRSSETGVEIFTRYKIGRTTFQWIKTSGKTVLQKAYSQKNGYYIITRNMAGETVSKARYGADHRWLQTAYYSGDITRPAALLKPKQGDGLVLLRFQPEKQKYVRAELEPCSLSRGTAEQSLVNTLVSEPLITCETDGGSFCYCFPGEKERRIAVENDLQTGARSIQPDWPREPDAPVEFVYIENEHPAPEPKPELPEPLAEAPCEPDYAADRVIFSTDEPVEVPLKYSVAAKGLGGEAQISDMVAPHLERAAKRIVISAEESYLYFGKIIDGLRQGRGRTQMKNGCTAYEGDYQDDKRDGFGVYYYKSGKVCYVGSWKSNLRDGVGVAYSSRDGSLFVGKWKDNIPTGSGAAFDAEGNLIYTGEWKDGLRHGHGTEYLDGEIIFSGEFREDHYYSGYQHIEFNNQSKE